MQPSELSTAVDATRRHDRLDEAVRARRAAQARRRPAAPEPEVTIRLARPADERALSRLAALDGAGGWNPGGDVLVAESGGEIFVARPLQGTPIADPFRATGELVALLDVRAGQLAGARRRHWRRRRAARVPRLAPVLRVGGAR